MIRALLVASAAALAAGVAGVLALDAAGIEFRLTVESQP